MSIEAVSLVLNHSKAQGRAKLVLIGIANHMGDQGAWPSISTLAKYANASERSVKRDIQELIDLGELEVQLQAAPVNSQYKTNLYWILVEPAGVTTQVSRGDKLGNSGVTPVGTQTIIKNHKEPNKRASRIAEDFQVTDSMREWALKEAPAIDVDVQTANFIDYWQSKSGNATKLDWVATWRTWMRNARPPIVPKPGGRGYDREKENAERRARLLAEMEANEQA